MNKVIIISGATASGKSALALDFAALKDVAIINADALQIYSGLPILSAQPNEEDKKIAQHFLYSKFKFYEKCSVVTWLELVKSTLDEVRKQNKIPLIVGGTGMYISKLFDGISEVPEISQEIKNEANNLFLELGKENFIKKLIELGEEKNIINLDKQRLIRLYEVLRQTKKTLKFWQQQKPKFIVDNKNFLHLNLEIDRDELYKNCNLRFEKMLKNNAIEEAKNLINQGVVANHQITKTLGFVEIQDFLNQKISEKEMIDIASQKTRNYAKRQLTWFRHQFKNKMVFNDKKSALDFLKNL